MLGHKKTASLAIAAVIAAVFCVAGARGKKAPIALSTCKYLVHLSQ